MQTAIPCVLMRGGTSRGAYFKADDLPADVQQRDQILCRVMGGPDALQVDGLGGGHPLTSKVALVKKSQRDDCDVDYLFLQVSPAEQTVVAAQNCGNILAGVGPFAIETGLVRAQAGKTLVRVYMQNSASHCELTVPTPSGQVNYHGDTSIDGVPGTAAEIVCDFLDIAGANCGALLPSGQVCDRIDGIDVSCVDNGMPVVILRATDVGITGSESPQYLDEQDRLKRRLESIRQQAGPLMHLGEVGDKTVPKMCLISPAVKGGDIHTRTFIPHVCHRSIGVLGAVSVATACCLPGTVAAGIAKVNPQQQLIAVEHPSGAMSIRLSMVDGEVRRAGVIRTARMIMRGEVFVPS